MWTMKILTVPVHTPLLSIGLSGISKTSIDIVKSSKLVIDREKKLCTVSKWLSEGQNHTYMNIYSCKVTCLFNKSMPPDYSDWHNVMNSLNTFWFRQRRGTFYSTRNFADLDQYHIWSHDNIHFDNFYQKLLGARSVSIFTSAQIIEFLLFGNDILIILLNFFLLKFISNSQSNILKEWIFSYNDFKFLYKNYKQFLFLRQNVKKTIGLNV